MPLPVQSNHRIVIDRFGAGIEAMGLPDPDLREDVCLFVHGYNADRESAVGQRSRLLATASRVGRVPSLLHDRLWTVMWPGFAEIGFRTAAWSFFTYPRHIETAQTAGRILADYLTDLVQDRPPRITFLGHSLGCRLVLETMSHLAKRWPPECLPLVILMAAAVPLDLLFAGLPLRIAAEGAGATLVLYSSRDKVLQTAFRLGQTAAWDGGFLPKAVGATGAPRILWSESLETANSHSSYFDDEFSLAATMRRLGAAVPVALSTRSPSERRLIDRPV
jgi:hypothetical protein